MNFAVDNMYLAGPAGAAAAAGADDAQAAAARGLVNRFPGMAGDVAIQLREVKLERLRSGFSGGHGAAQSMAGAAMRPDIVHFGADGQSSQRDQRTGGRSMPIPSIIDNDLSGCRTWPGVTLTPI